MQLEINKISPRGLLLDDSITLEENLLIEEESFFIDDIEYTVHFSRDKEKIKAKGNIITAVSLRCVNCLEYFDLRIDSDFDIILFPVSLLENANLGLNSDDMEYIFFEGDRIDVKKILMEQVNLFVPFKPVCSSSCKGLCPSCGTNLNYENCQCENSVKEVSFLFNKLKR